MSKLLFVFTLIFICACRDYAEVKVEGQNTTVRWEDGGIADVKIEKWRVGPLHRQELSMGVRVKVDFPALKESDVEELAKNHGVDSWLVTFSKGSVGRRERLGSFYMPLFRTSGRLAGGVVDVESGYIDLFYAAASISARLRALECPALDHRSVIGKAQVRETTQPRPLIVVGAMQEYPFMGKVAKLEFQRNIINGGMKLSGEYEVSIAFYNSKNNRVLSNDAIAPQVVVIGEESVKSIRGCENAKTPPLNNPGGGTINNFKFGH